MAFMIPYYTGATFHVAPDRHRETVAVPEDVHGTLDHMMDAIGTRDEDRDQGEIVRGKVWCSLSAPGYMDATEWQGPYATVALAKADLARTFDCDPETGDDDSEAST